MASANGGNSRFRYIGGSLYPDITAGEIAAACGNCSRAIRNYIGKPYDKLREIIKRLAPIVFSSDEWQRFMDNRPPGIFVEPWSRRQPPPAQVQISPATRLLLSEILACTEEMRQSMHRLYRELDGIYEIMGLVHPLEFAGLLRRSATKDSEFVRQQEWVKKWAKPGQETLYEELCERGSSLAADGRRALQCLKEDGAFREEIGIAATRGEVMVRRRQCGRKDRDFD